ASLLHEIDQAGFIGLYNFFYLPMDTHNRTNVGYAFVNFDRPQDMERFVNLFSGYTFQDHASQKIARVSPAHIQGFVENIHHFSNRAVSQSRNSQYRPLVIHQGIHMDLADAYALLCCPGGGSSDRQGIEPQEWFDPSAADVPSATTRGQAAFAAPRRAANAGPVAPTKRPKQKLLTPGPVLISAPGVVQEAPWIVPALTLSTLTETLAPHLAPQKAQMSSEDFGDSFCEAKKGFEAAISMLLQQSYQAQPVADGPPYTFGNAALWASATGVDDLIGGGDSSTEGESAHGSPRDGKSKAKAEQGLGWCEAQPETPRTNRTLFVHGRFSA
ncbi:unnamed protein product, partial [Polarella glacialis]